MKLFHKRARKDLKKFTATLERITVNAGVCRYNFKCHMNAVHDALQDEQKWIAVCIAEEDGFQFIHFVNYDPIDGYVDNTLGFWSQNQKYYLYTHVYKADFRKIDAIFTNVRNDLKSRLSFWPRYFSRIQF